ncbi:hypothetical protein [Microbacterium paludicola]|uniref:hypothetical protein n=1 Tax=Microbacterium paludicola TaxID=300019 RepID=UPI000A544CA0|nr:hypothetical protein [Microbacterium paludicola]
MSKNMIRLEKYEGGRPWAVYEEKLNTLARDYLLHTVAQQLDTTEDKVTDLVTTDMVKVLVKTLRENPDATAAIIGATSNEEDDDEL